jgi:hypothetical protein
MTDDELVTGLENIRNTMIAVATGGPRINEVNDQYQRTFATVTAELARRRIDNNQRHRNRCRTAGSTVTELLTKACRRRLTASGTLPLSSGFMEKLNKETSKR